MAATSRLSGLQKDVLALYRSILRETIRKDRKRDLSSNVKLSPSSTPSASSESLQPTQPRQTSVCQLLLSTSNNPPATASHSSSTSYARAQFRKEAALVRRSDFKTIEYKIRKGKKQLQLLQMPGVNVVGGF